MKTITLILSLLIISISNAQSFGKMEVLGRWQTYDEKTEKPNGIIEFFYSNGQIKAKVIDGPEVYNADKSLKKDVKNPDKTKRSRLVKGMVFIYGFTWDAENHKYKKGKIYDSRSGGTYSAQMQLVTKDKLKVTGYLGITLFGKTVYWTRIKK
jgi:uncharacterized protein (DUF2147 family)